MGQISRHKGRVFSKKKGDFDLEEGGETRERDPDREDGVFYSSSFNLLHDSNSSICNE